MGDMIFIGALPDAPHREKVPFVVWQSRSYKQSYRVYGGDIHQTLSGSEGMGRYWRLEIWQY